MFVGSTSDGRVREFGVSDGDATTQEAVVRLGEDLPGAEDRMEDHLASLVKRLHIEESKER